MRRYLDLYRLILRNFGFRLRPLGTFGLIQLRHALSAAGRSLDHLLAPGFAHQPIDRPVFVLGNPRSGTTFLHRFLLNTGQLAAFELWEMLLPAVTGRRALSTIIDRLAPLSPGRYHSSDAHETSLRDVETDDALELFHFVDGIFLWGYFHAWEQTWGPDTARQVFSVESMSPAERDRFFGYLEGCWKRNLYAKGKPRLVAKSFLLAASPQALLERYPDAKLVYLVRDPLATIPSGASLLTGVLEQSYDIFRATDPARRARYLENLYQASLHLHRVLLQVKRGELVPAENLRFVTYPQLMKSLEPTLEDLVGFLELDPPPAFWDEVRVQAEKQRNYQSKHAYSLEKFGLSEARIRSDLAEIYEEFDLTV